MNGKEVYFSEEVINIAAEIEKNNKKNISAYNQYDAILQNNSIGNTTKNGI